MVSIMKYIVIFTIILSAFGVLSQPVVAATPKNVPSIDSEYTVRPGDVLQITVWKEDGLDRETLVLSDGTITFPLIGSFNVQGMTLAALQSTIKAKLKSLIPDASVTVLVKAPLGHTVNIIGQVAKPGEIVIGQHLSVMQALSQAGGLTPYADDKKIIIIRNSGGQETSIPFPYSDVASGHSLEENIQLNPGDVIVVTTSGLF